MYAYCSTVRTAGAAAVAAAAGRGPIVCADVLAEKNNRIEYVNNSFFYLAYTVQVTKREPNQPKQNN